MGVKTQVKIIGTPASVLGVFALQDVACCLIIVRHPVKKSHFCGLRQQVGICSMVSRGGGGYVLHSPQGRGVMFFILHSGVMVLQVLQTWFPKPSEQISPWLF